MGNLDISEIKIDTKSPSDPCPYVPICHPLLPAVIIFIVFLWILPIFLYAGTNNRKAYS